MTSPLFKIGQTVFDPETNSTQVINFAGKITSSDEQKESPVQTIAVKASDLPASIRSLIGNAASVEVWPYEDGKTVTLGSVQWDSGSRDQYHVVHLDSGTVKPVQDVRPWPQNMAPIGETMIAPRCVIVKTGTFCGKPATPYIYARTADISPQLAAPSVELPFNLAQTLAAISQFNSMGRKRFREDFRMSQATWDSNVAALAALGLCDKRGAITVEGRNASRTIKRDITNPSPTLQDLNYILDL